MVKVKEIIDIVEEFAPSTACADWDNVGLQVGKKDDEVNGILLTLDVTQEVIRESSERGANLIICHHPITLGKIRSIDVDDFEGGRLWAAANSNINVIVAHTNLDACPGGVSDVLAERIELKEIEILFDRKAPARFKLVCFVPPANLEEVANAIVKAGGGMIGEYTHCTFRVRGTGTFKPGRTSKPSIGAGGKVNEVEEFRLETLVPSEHLPNVIAAMIEAHPYEAVAYDVYGLEDAPAAAGESSSFGLGRIGNLRRPRLLSECLRIWRGKLGFSDAKVSGDLSRTIERVAVCGGSGGGMIAIAAERGADVLLTGDVKYHDAQLADFLGLAVVDAGHYATEYPVVPKLASLIGQKLKDKAEAVKVMVSEVDTNPWNS